MGVRTTADEYKDDLEREIKSLRVSIAECNKLAYEVIDPDVWGSDNWSSEYVDKIYNLISVMNDTERFLREFVR